MKLVAIILTLNEEQHLPRCLVSLDDVVDGILVADSFSTDDTLSIAETHGARVVQHPFLNQSSQFNWALTQLDEDTDWVLRIDADEYLTPELAEEIKEKLTNIDPDIDGIYCGRCMKFQGKMIRFGGLFPIRVLRLFRYGRGECENRWMDEHIKVSGTTANFMSNIIDDNLNSLTWWTAKHNNYASREAVDLLNLKYSFMPQDSVASLKTGNQVGVKRWLKESVYVRMPRGLRAFAYFFYRYFLRLGFLDGSMGTVFHVLQGFWYRYLVDAKVAEVERHMNQHNCDSKTAIVQVLGIKIE